MAYQPPPPPPPTNGGTPKDYLQRIEAKADTAAEQSAQAMSSTLRLERALLGDFGNPGRIGLLEKKLSDFITASNARAQSDEANSHFRISSRMGSISVIVMALVGLGSIIVALVK